MVGVPRRLDGPAVLLLPEDRGADGRASARAVHGVVGDAAGGAEPGVLL